MFYILNGRKVVPVKDVLVWSKWIQTADRMVKSEDYKGYRVATIFTGLDYSYDGDAPVVFETMIFKKGSRVDMYCDRCSTYKQAEQMHEKAKKTIDDGVQDA